MGQGNVGSIPETVKPGPVKATARLVRAVDFVMRFIAGVAAALLTIVVLIGVVSRAFGDPYAWTDELSRLLMVWVAMFGWMLASRRHAHIRIRFFHDLLPPQGWAVAEAIMQLSVVVFGILVAVFGIELVERNSDVEAISMPIAMMWFYVPLVAAGMVATVQAAVDVYEAIRQGVAVSQ
ncbi:MAG: TRAP transporter small permease subunit [Alphaproteobacteria bacterium]|nr:TRAP transporter small permease subunit [Alphaproteobacteria bacterium]